MKHLFALLTFSLVFGPARAETNLCQEGIVSLTKSRQIPFQFEPDSQKLKDATSFDTKKNPKVYRRDNVTLEVFESEGQVSKYKVTHEKNCAKHCDHLTLSFDVDHQGDQCSIQRAQVKDDLNERTLWTREICQELKKHKSAAKPLDSFVQKHSQWISEYKIQRKNFQDPEMLLKQIDSNCWKYDKYFEARTVGGESTGSSVQEKPVSGTH